MTIALEERSALRNVRMQLSLVQYQSLVPSYARARARLAMDAVQ